MTHKKKNQHVKQIKKITDHCMKLIEKNNHRELIKYLKEISAGGSDDFHQEIDMTSGGINIPNRIKMNELIDSDGFTLLHMSVFTNR